MYGNYHCKWWPHCGCPDRGCQERTPLTWKAVIPAQHHFFKHIRVRPDKPFTPGEAMCNHGDKPYCNMHCPCMGDDPDEIDPRL